MSYQEKKMTMQLIELLQGTARFLWKEWPQNMHLSRMDNNSFVLAGECPHCGKEAAFPTILGTFEERQQQWPRIIGAACCIACSEYILGILQFNAGNGEWRCIEYYPLGKPKDKVNDAIPDEIKPDLQEAIRCRFVDAYNATIEMCRRALEASCIQLGASPDLVLSKMIDWVHTQGKIVSSVRDMAHKIKLGGNRAAHPSSDRTLTADDADAVLEFTMEYFQHVYVVPARMAKFETRNGIENERRKNENLDQR